MDTIQYNTIHGNTAILEKLGQYTEGTRNYRKTKTQYGKDNN